MDEREKKASEEVSYELEQKADMDEAVELMQQLIQAEFLQTFYKFIGALHALA